MMNKIHSYGTDLPTNPTPDEITALLRRTIDFIQKTIPPSQTFSLDIEHFMRNDSVIGIRLTIEPPK